MKYYQDICNFKGKHLWLSIQSSKPITMAKLTGPIKFIGTIGGLSTYQIDGSDEIYARQKGGPSSSAVKNDESFKNTRRNNAEFKIVNDVADDIKKAFGLINCLRDYNYTPDLNGICLDIKNLDAESEWGQRGYLFSLYGHLLEGFSFNRKQFFSSIIRPAVKCDLHHASAGATITIPTLKPGSNFFLPWAAPMFRFVITLGTIDDMVWKEKSYAAVSPLENSYAEIVETPWFFASDTMPTQSITLQLSDPELLDAYKNMIVCIGIQAGAGNASDTLKKIRKVKYGVAKILKIG